jgi:molybdopterin adenylyltransferase
MRMDIAMGLKSHRAKGPESLNAAVLSVSTSRTLETDKSGQWIAKQLGREGHRLVAHQVVPDVARVIRAAVLQIVADPDQAAQALIITGGTGISPQDVTIEAVRPLFAKELTAFGPIFAQISYEQIDSAAILSRATAGIIDRCLVFCLPGSLKAVQLACKALILPELGHLYGHTIEH